MMFAASTNPAFRINRNTANASSTTTTNSRSSSTMKGGSLSPNAPSIVSLTSDIFEAGGMMDVDSSNLSDLFEGSLCDDELNEIPSLLNLASGVGAASVFESQPTPMMMMMMMFHETTSQPIPNTGGYVDILPATANGGTHSAASRGSAFVSLSRNNPAVKKRGMSYRQAVNGSGSGAGHCSIDSSPKRTKFAAPMVVGGGSGSGSGALVMNPIPTINNPAMLQNIHPLAKLPSTSEVSGSSVTSTATATTGFTADGSRGSNYSSSSHSNDPYYGYSKKNSGVDTSTNHIKALTGVNGPAVCLDAIEQALKEAGGSSNDGSSSAAMSVFTTSSTGSDNGAAGGYPLSTADKAKQSRDRNRQHARNTRVRKKAYVEELKRTLNELVEERDTVVHQRRTEHQGIQEQRDVRLRVIEDFLNLRGRNEGDPNRWGLILEDGFCLRLPRSDIPGVVCSSGGPSDADTVQSGGAAHSNTMCFTSKKILTGISQVMEDSNMVSNLLQSLGASPMSVSYQCDRESIMMDNTNVVLSWTATSSGAVIKGASAEFTIQGTARVRFNPVSNKLVSMEFTF